MTDTKKVLPTRCLAISVLVLSLTAQMLAQSDQFPLLAKVVSSDMQRVSSGSSTSMTTAMPGTIWQHPQQNTRIDYRYEITVTAEIEKRVYRLYSPQLLDPGEYPANIDGHTIRLLLKDKKGKPRTLKLRIFSVSARQEEHQ